MPANLFIVEDEMPIVTLLKYNLEKEGHKVNFAKTEKKLYLQFNKKIQT